MDIIQDSSFTFIGCPFGDFQAVKDGIINIISQVGLAVAITGPLGTEDQAAGI